MAFFSFLKVFTTFGILLYFITHQVHQPLPFSMFFQTIAILIAVKKKKLVVKEMKIVVGIFYTIKSIKASSFQIHPVLIVLL